MINKLIEGKYNNSKIDKKKIKVSYRGIFIIKSEDGTVSHFEARELTDITTAIQDIIKFLKNNKDENQYVLQFNRTKLKISSNSNVKELVSYYDANYRKDVYSL